MTNQPSVDPAELELPCGRAPLVAAITAFLAGQDAQNRVEVRAILDRELDAAGPDALNGMVDRLAKAGGEWGYYARDPLARRINHLFADRILGQTPVLSGAGADCRLDGARIDVDTITATFTCSTGGVTLTLRHPHSSATAVVARRSSAMSL